MWPPSPARPLPPQEERCKRMLTHAGMQEDAVLALRVYELMACKGICLDAQVCMHGGCVCCMRVTGAGGVLFG